MQINKINNIANIIAKNLSKNSIKEAILNVIHKDLYQNYNWMFLNMSDGISYCKGEMEVSCKIAKEIMILEKTFDISKEELSKSLTIESLEKYLRNLSLFRIISTSNPENDLRVKEFAEKVIFRYPNINIKQLIRVYHLFIETNGIFGKNRMERKIEEIEQFLR